MEEEYQRCCHALERQEEELRKCRAQVWMARHWWEQRLQWLFPASFQPTLWPPDRPLPSSAEPRFPVEIRRLDQYPERRPVFILGSVRSGTSAMCGALRVGAKFFGWEEGFLFATLPGLMKAVNETWDKAREGGAGFSMEHTALPHADIYSLLNAMVRGCDRMYAAWAEQKGASRWVEKTPDSGMMLAAPLVQHVYPQSR
ncbi:MAG: hypothetical protein JO112_00565, partial [Planctomycetes bacterium]|nr:hypothetical protein [Planctomycetota bacterium]